MKVYLAGPMTGIPQFNFPAFDRAAKALRDAGYEVVSPSELDDPVDRAAALASETGAMGTGSHIKKSWGDFLARDVKLLADGDILGVVVLPGWQNSRGARLETFVASRMCSMPIFYYYEGWLPHLDAVDPIDLMRAWGNEMWNDIIEVIGGAMARGRFVAA